MKNKLVRTQNVIFSETDKYNDLITAHRNPNTVRTFFWHKNDEANKELEINLTNARTRENKQR